MVDASDVDIGRFAGRQQTSTIQANNYFNEQKIQTLKNLLCAVDSFVEFSAILELVISRLATMMIGKHRRADDALITVARKIVLLPENF
ncbi:hypothetical protein T02_1969 [Trichinella nativa]|uniref:Uncharacterized protein n=1 Tax=Trichinella nativa TaxID=6335 RepID=A0A0V1LI70_9BILA|nr:hypothetical protein T02_1969 [Trichinella nativa]